jgi:hypothetical protein
MKRIVISFSFLLFTLGSFAQGDLMMYSEQNIPQSVYNNPSNQFNGKFFIGIPALSSVDNRFSNRFRYSDLIEKQNDSLKLSFEKLLSRMKDNNYLNAGLRADILSFGYSINDQTQISFNISEVASVNLAISKDLVEFIYLGNAAFENRNANFDDLGINATHYREYGLGLSHQLNDQWRLGLRAKYLYGMENIYTERMDIQLTTDPETYALNATTNFALHTSGIDMPDSVNESLSEYLLAKNNRGMAIDLGVNYQLNDRINLSMSIIDWGFIRWNDRNLNYFGEGNFIYDGIEVNAFTDDGQDLSDDTSFDRVLDSLEKELGIEESNAAYTSPLVTQLYLGGSIQIDQYSQAGMLMRTDIFKSKIRPSFSLTYHRQMNEWLSLSAAYSSLNSTFDNIGLGFIVNPGPVQFYMMTDNLIGAFQPQHARNLHLRFGINLIFGSEKDGPKRNVAKRKTRKAFKSIRRRNNRIKKSDF